MGFNLVNIDKNSIDAIVQENSATTESVVSTCTAYNTGDTDQKLVLKVDTVKVFEEPVLAGGSYRLPDKFSIPVGKKLTATTGEDVVATISIYEQSLDPSAATTLVQQKAQQAVDAEASISPYYPTLQEVNSNLTAIQNASANADAAKASEVSCAASANNKGAWSDLTDSLSVHI